jgi:transcription initiation factor TFIID TATA-box-binding protein
MSETSPYDVKIQNVVAVVTLDLKLDLLAIMKAFRNVKYDPERFPALVFRLKRPRTSTLIFATGKMVCTGARSEKEAFSAVRNVVWRLRKSGFVIRGEPDILITNIVASADVGGEVDLEEAADVLDKIMYEPEQFPGLIYRMTEPKVVLLIFASGEARDHRGQEGGAGP